MPVPSTNTIAAGQKQVTEDGKNGLPVREVDGSGNQLGTSTNPQVVSPMITGTSANGAGTGAATAITATIAAAAGKYSYLTGFEVGGLGATAASVITITVTGTQGGTMTYYLNVPAGATTIADRLVVEFTSPIQSSAVNTAIVVNVPSFGAGNTAAAVNAHGYQL